MPHGLTPGNDLFTVKANVTYPFIFGLLVAAFVMVIVGVLGAKQFAKVNRIPQNFLASGILVLTVLGAFSCNNSYADVFIMLGCGVLGYALKYMKIDLSSVVLGYIFRTHCRTWHGSHNNNGRFSGSSGYVNCDQANLYCLNRYLHCIAGCSDLQ